MAVKVEDLFYNNLLLLGFDRETIKSNYGIEVNKNTFSGQGNTKAMEVVLHFLFSKISPTATKETFAVLFPVTTKQQASAFRSAAAKFITDLQVSGHLPPNTFRTSLLHTCCGDKFYHLLWHLSTYALKCELTRRGVALPPMITIDNTNSHCFDAAAEATKLHILRQSKSFLSTAARLASEQSEWRTFAAELIEEYKDVLAQRAKLEKDIQVFEQTLAKTKEAQLPPPEQVKKAESLWSALVNHVTSKKDAREMIEAVVDKRANSFRIDGKDVSLTPNARTALGSILGDQVTQSLYGDNGKPDLLGFLHAWEASLRKIHSMMIGMEHLFATPTELEKENIGTASRQTLQTIATLQNLATLHQQHSVAAQSLKSNLSARLSEAHSKLPELESKVDAAAQRSVAAVFRQTSDSTPRKTRETTLNLVPPTPRISYNESHSQHTVPSFISLISRTESFDEETAISECMMSIKSYVKNRNPRVTRSMNGAIAMQTTHRHGAGPALAADVFLPNSISSATRNRTPTPSPLPKQTLDLDHLRLSPLRLESTALQELEQVKVTTNTQQRPKLCRTKDVETKITYEMEDGVVVEESLRIPSTPQTPMPNKNEDHTVEETAEDESVGLSVSLSPLQTPRGECQEIESFTASPLASYGKETPSAISFFAASPVSNMSLLKENSTSSSLYEAELSMCTKAMSPAGPSLEYEGALDFTISLASMPTEGKLLFDEPRQVVDDEAIPTPSPTLDRITKVLDFASPPTAL